MRARRERRQPSAPVEPWRIYFFKRHPADDADEVVPGKVFLDACAEGVRAKLMAVVVSVSKAPPPAFSGGGRWEAMHGEMAGIYEVRTDGAGREHMRLFCVLERRGEEHGLGGPALVIITGLRKPFRTTFSKRDYAKARALRDEYEARTPRSVS